MFEKLNDLGFVRTGKQAVGFYLAYLLLIILLGALAGALSTVAVPNGDPYETGVLAGMVVAIVACVILSFSILSKKQLLNNFGFVLLALLAGVLAYFGGGLLGLIPATYLSTRPAAGKIPHKT